MDCLKCSVGKLEAKGVKLEAEYRGEAFEVSMPGLQCPACNYVTVRGDDMAEYMRRSADEYRKAHGLLTSDQIRERRQGLGMSQIEFAKYLDIGIASIKRWELGQVQDQAMNELIVLKTDPEAASRNCKELYQRVKGSQSGAQPKRRSGPNREVFIGTLPQYRDPSPQYGT
jgi:putative zinc finger/helix-turn-helix YgiT family protein